jgi:hypothetical protein
MNEQALRELLDRCPFQPLEIELSSGERHVVRHPENVMLTRTRLVLVNPIVDSVVVVTLLHITRVAFSQAA